MSEKQIQDLVVSKLRSEDKEWKSLTIVDRSDTNPCDKKLSELVGEMNFDVLVERPLVQSGDGMSTDLFWGQKPDIVIRSRISKQNRIIIEVKKASCFTHKEFEASQVARYFFHLLATTDHCPKGKVDISRAVVLAAPISWFRSTSKAKVWEHFIAKYGPLAKTFRITLGEIHTDL